MAYLVYMGLGTNLGHRGQNLRTAIMALNRIGRVREQSPVYETAPLLVTDQPRFLNMAVSFIWKHDLESLLPALKAIEAQMGRDLSPTAPRYGPRPIDIDILLALTWPEPSLPVTLQTPELTVPHPRLAERAFALYPLRDLAPDLVVPGKLLTVADLARRVPEQDIVRLGDLKHVREMASAGYSQTELAKKLGIQPGMRVALLHPPDGYLDVLRPALAEVTVAPRLEPGLDLIHFFTTRRADLEREFPRLKAALAPQGALWISWPKHSATIQSDLREILVREVGLANELVDVKVAAIDNTWSGLKFVYRRADRRAMLGEGKSTNHEGHETPRKTRIDASANPKQGGNTKLS